MLKLLLAVAASSLLLGCAAPGQPFAQTCKPQSERSCPGDASEPFVFVGKHP